MNVEIASLDSTLVALELQLQDVEEYFQGKEGNTNAATSDEQAFEIQREELNCYIQYVRDLLMSRSISLAVHDDAVILSQVQAEQNHIQRDRNEACMLAGIPAEENETTSAPLDSFADDRIDELSAWNIFRSTETEGGPSKTTGTECTACVEWTANADSFSAPCDHTYCTTCIKKLFEDAIQDETLFPPRCCRQEISISKARDIIGPSLTQKTELRAIELGTRDRTYCSNPDCAHFLCPDLIRANRATCPKCHQSTCTDCKKKTHGGTCEASQEEETLSLAKDAGWRRCFQCRAVVELSMGCNHMTCRCGAQFCYVCGLKWKSCHCELWEENMLHGRAAMLGNREAHANAANNLVPNVPAQQPQRIRQLMEELRPRHECNHAGQWQVHWGEGYFECENCNVAMQRYIMECRGCRLRVCARCQTNRL